MFKLIYPIIFNDGASSGINTTIIVARVGRC